MSDSYNKSRRIIGFPAALVLIMLILTGAGIYVYQLTISETKKTLAGIREDLLGQNITQTFITRQLKVASTNGGNLEVATATATEHFERRTNLTLWNQVLPLGTTVSEISVPATYRFHVKLNEPWSLSVRGDSCIVVAPPVEPSLPVAFDSAGMRKKTTSGWARWDKGANLRELEESITTQLAQRASSPPHIDQAREAGRQSVATFVKNWLLREDHWQEGRFTKIKVLFADELDRVAPDEMPATLQIPVGPADAPE